MYQEKNCMFANKNHVFLKLLKKKGKSVGWREQWETVSGVNV